MVASNNMVEKGASLLISRNLGMSRGQDVVIIVDEETYKVGLVLEKAARTLEVSPTLILVTREQQAAHNHHEHLSPPLSQALASAQGIANALSDYTNGTGFRVAILREGLSVRCKIAHMPGLTTEMVASLADTDYDILEKGCATLQAPLLLGSEVLIITNDNAGNHHQLRLDLGGWDYPPVVSSGIVHKNSFDNVPSGEVYIPPVKGTAEGTVVINGSITEYVFGEGDEILVHFVKGAVDSIEPPDHPAAKILQDLIKRAKVLGDAEPHFLCELGIGVNTAVKALSGGTLMDEKAYKTAHIAIGTNVEFGGDVEAPNIHEDLVFHNPTILVDGREIVRQGELAVMDGEWRPDYKTVEDPAPFNDSDTLIEWTGNPAEQNDDNLLERIFIDGTDVRQRIVVGNSETAALAATVFKVIPHDDAVSIGALVEKLDMPEKQLQQLLYVMGKIYRLVQVST